MNKLKQMYEDGKLSKHEYIDRCYAQYHKVLHDYSEFLMGCDISSIEISDSKVTVTTRNHGLKFICPPNDKRVVGIETLNFGAYEEEETKERGENKDATLKDDDMLSKF